MAQHYILNDFESRRVLHRPAHRVPDSAHVDAAAIFRKLPVQTPDIYLEILTQHLQQDRVEARLGQLILQQSWRRTDKAQTRFCGFVVEERVSRGQVQQLALPTLQASRGRIGQPLLFDAIVEVGQRRSVFEGEFDALAAPSSAGLEGWLDFNPSGAIRWARARRTSTAALKVSSLSAAITSVAAATALENGGAGCDVT